jgi:uncharacterized membrane protein
MNQKLTWILFGAILVNVLLAGTVIGRLFSDRYGRHHRPPPPHGMEKVLSKESSQKLDAIMKKVHEMNQKLEDDFKAAREALTKEMTADRFNKVNYLAATKRLHDLHGQRVGNLAAAVAELAPHLSVEERRQLAETLKRGPGGPKGPGPGRGEHPPPHHRPPPDHRPPPPPFD